MQAELSARRTMWPMEPLRSGAKRPTSQRRTGAPVNSRSCVPQPIPAGPSCSRGLVAEQRCTVQRPRHLGSHVVAVRTAPQSRGSTCDTSASGNQPCAWTPLPWRLASAACIRSHGRQRCRSPQQVDAVGRACTQADLVGGGTLDRTGHSFAQDIGIQRGAADKFGETGPRSTAYNHPPGARSRFGRVRTRF